MANLTSSFFACERSKQVNEQLYGTAPRVDVWIALEYYLPWGRDALPESDLSAPVKQRLTAQLKAIPNSRFQFIRQTKDRPPVVYIAVSRENSPVLYRFDLTSYDDLLTLDLAAIAAGSQPEHALDERLYLVCTNGRRDKCCSKFGVPVFHRFEALAGLAAWETTHLGGHRFAATAVFLPHGVCYGRVTDNDVAGLVEAYHQNRLSVEFYRGRSCYTEPVQAAEYFLRRETGEFNLDRYRVAGFEKVGESGHKIRFEESGQIHELQIQKERSEFSVFKNSDNPENGPVPQFYLDAYLQR